ncbi:hypothetical protein GCM10020220_005520 [Nonomuraea rubra]|uniref:SidA/IucD/PvdA family monooxygenase n=1 Tax=Nonomuraea rubra TaxID=46180 RepID=UPI0031EA1C8D
MQVSFLKDLVTMRTPTSEFSFLCYLQDRDRLIDFINHKTMFPSRMEFHDYLEWAAARFSDQVEYGSEVVAVTPVESGGTIDLLDVVVRQGDGTLVTRRTRNLVLAAGLEPVLPDGLVSDDRVWHSEELLGRLPRGCATRTGSWCVGAGQSAAEVTEHLHGAYPGAEVCAVFGKYGYTPADDSSFANRIFDPVAVDHFYTAPDEVKSRLRAYHATTNYSVVDLDLIDELYRRHYQEKVQGKERLRILTPHGSPTSSATTTACASPWSPAHRRAHRAGDRRHRLRDRLPPRRPAHPARRGRPALRTPPRRRRAPGPRLPDRHLPGDALRHLRPGRQRAHPRH